MTSSDNSKPSWFKTNVHGSDKSYTTDSAKEIRRLQEQCYLIDNWRMFVSYSMLGRDKPEDNFKNFTPLHGGSPESLVSLLTGKSNTQILFDMSPAQKAALVPKIRIFKSYLTNKSKKRNIFEDIEIHFPSEAFNREDINNITKDKFGRGHGVGIKAFEWIYDGKDPAQVKYSTKCKMTMFFQNMSDFVKERISSDGKHTYRFSDIINPHEAPYYNKGKSGSGVTSRTRNRQTKDNDSLWRLKATVGWSKPEAKDRKLFPKNFLAAIEDCVVVLYLTVTTHEINFNQDGSLEVVVNFVGALDNAFTSPSANVFVDPKDRLEENDHGAGLIEELKAELRRRKEPENEQNTPNAVDHLAGNRDSVSPYYDWPEERLRAKIKQVENNVSLHTAKQNVRRHQRLMRDLIQSGRIKRATVLPEELGIFGNFQLTRQGLAQFRRARINGDLTEDQLIQAGVNDPETRRRLLTKEFIQTTADSDTPWTDSTRGRQYKKTRRGHAQAGRDNVKEDSQNSQSLGAGYRKFTDNYQKSGLWASSKQYDNKSNWGPDIIEVPWNVDTGPYGYKDKAAGPVVKKIKASHAQVIEDLDVASSLKKLKRKSGEASPPLTIEFMYFGDIIDAALNALSSHPDRENMRILLGDLYFTDPFLSENDKRRRKVQINLADIPISLNMFQVWFHNRIVKRDIAHMSAADFIKDLISYIINPVFGTACVSPLQDSIPRNLMNVKTFSFNAPSGTDSKGRPIDRLSPGSKKSGRLFFKSGLGPGKGLVAGDHTGRSATNNVNVRKSPTLQTPSGAPPTSIFNYSLLHATIHNVNMLRGNEEEDSANGIYHVRVGADRGLVKKFNFKAETRKYAAEAAVVDRNQRSNIEGLRGSKYNCDIEMIGNPLFQNGQYIFIDPTMMGFGNYGSDSYEQNQRLLRLGGYYLIIEVQCSIDSAGFQTTLKTLWESFPSNYSPARTSVEQISANNQVDQGSNALDPHAEVGEEKKRRASEVRKVDDSRSNRGRNLGEGMARIWK